MIAVAGTISPTYRSPAYSLAPIESAEPSSIRCGTEILPSSVPAPRFEHTDLDRSVHLDRDLARDVEDGTQIPGGDRAEILDQSSEREPLPGATGGCTELDPVSFRRKRGRTEDADPRLVALHPSRPCKDDGNGETFPFAARDRMGDRFQLDRPTRLDLAQGELGHRVDRTTGTTTAARCAAKKRHTVHTYRPWGERQFLGELQGDRRIVQRRLALVA